MQNLAQLTPQVEEQYADLRSYVIPTEKISLTESGFLNTGKNEFPLSREASEQFARLFKIPVGVYLRFEADLRALIFNRWFRIYARNSGIGQDVRIHLYQDGRIIGYDDPKLFSRFVYSPELKRICQVNEAGEIVNDTNQAPEVALVDDNCCI